MIQQKLAIWSLITLPFLKLALHLKFSVHVLLTHKFEDYEHYLTSMQKEVNHVVVWTFFSIALFSYYIQNWLFQFCGHWWVFQICWHIECSTFTASSFRIRNSSAGIPSLPLALFVVMLLKAHFTSHSKMSHSRWTTTPSWLSRSWRPFWKVLPCILATPSLSILLLLGPYHFFPLLCLFLHEMFPL